MVDPLPTEVVRHTPCLVDPGVVHHKRRFATPNLTVMAHKCPDARKERFGIKGAIPELEVLDPLGGDDHQQRQVLLSVCHDFLSGRCSFGSPGSERGRVEVEHTLVEEPELLIRDLVDDGSVVVALFDALGFEDDASPRCRLLVRQALVVGNPGDGPDARVNILTSENILRLLQSHCRRLCQHFPDSPLVLLGPHRLPPLLLWPVDDLVAAVEVAIPDLSEEVLGSRFGYTDRCGNHVDRRAFGLVELGEEATDDLLVESRPLLPPLFGWAMRRVLGGAIGGVLGKVLGELLGVLTLVGGEGLRRFRKAHCISSFDSGLRRQI